MLPSLVRTRSGSTGVISAPCAAGHPGPASVPTHAAGIGGPSAKIAAMRIGLVAVLIGLVVAGCGGNASTTGEPPATTTTTVTETVTQPMPATTPEQHMSLRLYFVAPDGKLVAASRDVQQTQTPGAASLHELLTPPAGATTRVPDGLSLAISDGHANVTGADLGGAALAQVVYTLTSFPTVQTVNGKTRADVEQFVPQILVEQPSAGETVTSPLQVTGNANTYEATFDYRLEDAAGKLLAKNFVTATSGSGTRGTFDFTIPFTVDATQDGALKVFELSAENGSVVHERVIPLRLSP
jgi:Immunoglobulin-like domain of bacterial spore germination/Sporulation and spore germination